MLENIRDGRPGATDEEVELAAQAAHAHEFIELDRGYHTLQGERGPSWSGGQRQRIAIARRSSRMRRSCCWTKFSALDSHSEYIIQAAMRDAMAGKTVIAIAHRLSTLMDMDRLIVLDRGRIVADGSHDELLRRGGLYAELWQRQSGGFNPVARPVELEQAAELADFDGQATGGFERPGALEDGEKA